MGASDRGKADRIPGRRDPSSREFLFEQATNLHRLLMEVGIEHEYNETAGGHTWINWRSYLHDFARQLFR